MANTKINLNKQSDLSLTNANITSPIGIEKTDLPGLVGDLEGLSATDNENAAALAAETTRALQAEKVVTEAISAEAAAARAAELGLSNQIADIISNVDPAALDSLTEVVGAFQAADGDLSAAITAALGTHSSELATEIADRISGDAATLASAKVYTDALEASHVADKAAADAAIVAAKAASDGEIADAKSAADAARVAAKAASDAEIAAAKSATDAARVAAKSTSDGEIADAKSAADAARVAAKSAADAAADAMQADVDQNEADADASFVAMQADVDQNEADADAANAATQADVDKNEADSDAAFVAMDSAYKAADAAALVTSEASFATMQADVDANQAASEAAELGLSNQIANIISNVDPAALDSLTEVVGAFQAADGDLSAAITAALGTHTSELAIEIADRISGDAATLASAKVYTDALEALHISDEAAAAAAIVAAKAASDGEIADAKSAADAARVAAKAASDDEIAAAKSAADEQLKAISDDVDANQAASEAANVDLTEAISINEKAIISEMAARIAGDDALDVRVSALISNEDLASNDSITEVLAEVNRVSSLNIEAIYSKAIGSTFNSELGTIVLDSEVKPGSHMFYMNGLLMADKSDFIATESPSGYVTGATLIGDSLTLANAGGVIATYGVYGETTEAEFENFVEGGEPDTIIRKGE